MTKPTPKPKRHPTFTIDELHAIRVVLSTLDADIVFYDPHRERAIGRALEKILSAIAYREKAWI